jgi:hypothetical protein
MEESMKNLSLVLALALALGCAGHPTTARSLNLGKQRAAIALSAGSNNNVAITSPSGNTTTVMRFTVDAAGSTVSGLDASTVSDGDLFIVRNESATGNLTLTNADTSSLAANRLLTPGAVSVILAPRGSALVTYDSTLSRWMASLAPTSPTFVTDVTIGSTGHLLASSASTPALSSCGGSPAIVASSTDVAGKYTSGSAATTCTITFATTWGTAPTCIVAPEGSATMPTYTVSATAITVSVDIASTTYNYICIGR